MSKEEDSKIASDGLRYKYKPAGSSFSAKNFGNGNGTLSCFKCGKHKPRALGSYKMILGNATFFCGDCRPPVASVASVEPTAPISPIADKKPKKSV